MISYALPRPARKHLALAMIVPSLILAACGGGSDDNADASASTGIPDPTTADATDDRDPRTESSSLDGAGDQSELEAASEPQGEPQQEPDAAPVSADARVAQDGDTVEVIYHGTLESGEIFDSSRDRGDTLSFVVGSGQLIDGFDNAVRGLAVGQSVVARLDPDEAYGQRDPSLSTAVPIAQAPPGLVVGDVVTLSNGAPATVIEVTADTVVIDLNHQLAGQILTFEIEVVSIQ